MKKTLLIISSILLIAIGFVYTLLFTQIGNSLLKPSIETKINEHSPIPLALDTFSLSPSTLKLLLKLDEENSILLNGSYSLFAQNFDIDYDIRLSKLSNLNHIVKRQLSGKLLTDGNVQGNLELFKVKGKSNLALSKTEYAIVIKNKNLDKAAIKLVGFDIGTILSMLGEKAYSQGKIDLHVQLNELDPANMQGNVLLNIKKAQLNAKTIKNEFGISLDKTSVKGNLSATLEGTRISYLAKLDSVLAKIYSKGKLETDTHNIDGHYKIDIRELALLKSITNAPLRGPFFTQGEIKGEERSLRIKGKSDLARSKTSYKLELIDFQPSLLNVKINNASLERLLYLVGEPSYATGKLNLAATLDSFTPLNGKLALRIDEGIAHKKEIKQAFDITLPYTKFDLISDVNIKKDTLLAKTTLNSNLATVKMDKTSYDIKSASLLTDYDIFVPSLQRLEPTLEKKLYGKVRANGEVRKDKKLTITAHSNIFEGKLNAKIVDEKIDLSFNELHAIKVLEMLGYPKVMDAPVNGTLVYNTQTKQGKLDSRFEKARLQPSQMTDLIHGLTRTDLTKERFNDGSLVSLIDNDIIKSDLIMQSKTVNLKSKKFIINSKKQLIDARFALKVKKYPGDIIVTGNINSPKVKLDAESMITPEIEDKVEKEINRFLKKLF